jgi:hypothetical protein
LAEIYLILPQDFLTSLTPALSPKEREWVCASFGWWIIVRRIQPLVFSRKQGAFHLLLGEKAGMRAVVQSI